MKNCLPNLRTFKERNKFSNSESRLFKGIMVFMGGIFPFDRFPQIDLNLCFIL